MRKLLFIYNPRAGKERIRSNLLDIIDIFTKAGFMVTTYPTQGRGDARRVVAGRKEEYEMVAVSGGDGTLDEVVNGMLDSDRERLPIGYVPAGSTNDFASSLGIPSGMRAAAEVITKGRKKACDIGFLNDNSFVYVAAFGIFTDVSYETGQNLKNLLGHVAYILEGAKKLSEIREYHIKIRAEAAHPTAVELRDRISPAEEELVIEDDFYFGMVTNSDSVGGFKGITGGNIDLSDGVFEVTLIRHTDDIVELGGILAALANRSIHSDYVLNFKTSRLELESDEEIAWTRDGEYGGSFSRSVIHNEREALEIMVP